VEREQRGKNEARRLRAAGKIPAVVYGVREGGKAIAVDPKPLTRILQTELGANTLITLNLPGGGDARVLVKEYQYDPVTHQLLHVIIPKVEEVPATPEAAAAAAGAAPAEPEVIKKGKKEEEGEEAAAAPAAAAPAPGKKEKK